MTLIHQTLRKSIEDLCFSINQKIETQKKEIKQLEIL